MAFSASSLYDAAQSVVNSSKFSKFAFLSPFIFIENKRCVMSSEGFSVLEKKGMICSQRVMLPIQIGCDSPPGDSNNRLAHFFLKFELAGSDVAAHC
jgi:hypothetical protein